MSSPRTDGYRDGDDGRTSPASSSDRGWDGFLIFGADGRLVAATSGVSDAAPAPIATVDELQARYQQTDGMPIDLRRRGRYVAIPLDGRGPRVVLMSEPLEAANGLDAALAVAVDVFRSESDPETVQRALGSVLAHELRTPMTTVYGGAELLLRPELPEVTRVEAARSVADAAERLHRVIEDLVVLVRWPGEGGDDDEPVLLQPILRGVVRRVLGRGVRIVVDAPADVPSVMANPAFVEQIMRDLLEHGVANTPPGGAVEVAVRDAGEWVEIIVRDGGASLADDERERAFDLFAPRSRRAADASGANLPLVAARRLVERLGGRIEAGRPPDGGETIVRLPAIADPDAPEPL